MKTLIGICLMLMSLTGGVARAAADPQATLARLQAGHDRVTRGGPLASRVALDPAEAATRRPSVALVMPASWEVSAADWLDLYPQDVLRIDADDAGRGEALEAAVSRLGVRLVVAVEPEAATAGRQAGRLALESPALTLLVSRGEASVTSAWPDANGRLHWATTPRAAAVGEVSAPVAKATVLPWFALFGIVLAVVLVVAARRFDLAQAVSGLVSRHARPLARQAVRHYFPPRPAMEHEATAEVERLRATNPQLVAVLGRLQDALRDDVGLAVATDQAMPEAVPRHALLVADRYIPAALAARPA